MLPMQRGARFFSFLPQVATKKAIRGAEGLFPRDLCQKREKVSPALRGKHIFLAVSLQLEWGSRHLVTPLAFFEEFAKAFHHVLKI